VKSKHIPLAFSLSICGGVWWLVQGAPATTGLQRQANGEMVLSSSATVGEWYQVQGTPSLTDWQPLATVQSAGADQWVDSAAPFTAERFYRTVPATGTGLLSGDHLPTANGDAILHPVGHASVVVSWDGKMIYSDPSGAGTLFAGLAKADVIVVTHAHGDHFSTTTLAAVLDTDGVIFAPQAVFNGMTAALKARTTVMANGATATAHGIDIEAVAMYNLSNSNHPKGVGNGYVVTLGGKRLYFSGDTENTPEMCALTNIDAAFLCMSLPSNMTVDDAASAVRAFKPKIVTPYHYRQGSTTFDIARFKQLVGTDLGIEVRLRKYY
jgi:L-ascorbate metabolism protein UlaG (beta-lactamase superfamily)